ncbi:unnamed protein product [Candidula unifasciata]|uniref:Hexosyltransferase n=1 Tax=Candidula unifasciata TaxID=100452 RepID=A0A8S3YWD4_9EUPU|nr:unnamed protein product [Candidula unifasciata]
MQASKSTVGTCCRRRTFTNKILPAILQAFIAVALWEGLKSILPLSKTSDENSIKNARSLDETKCPVTDVSQSKTLTLLDLSSVISLAQIPSQGQSPTYHTKVDVYARDEKRDTLILYPAGSIVDFGGLKARITEEILTNEDIGKTDYEVEIDENENNDVKEGLANRKSGPPVKNGTVGQVPFDKAPQITNYVSKDNAEDRVERFKPEDELSQESHGGSRNNANFRIPENQEKLAVRGTSNVKIPQSNKQSAASKGVESKRQSDPFEYLKKLHQNLAKNMASVDSLEASNMGGYDTQRLGNEMSSYGNQFGYSDKDNIHNADSKLFSRGILIDETGERLYADGFLDRVSKLSTELFGKLTNNVSANEEPIKLSMNSPLICANVKDVEVFFLINSAPQNSDLRQRIRDTFVNPLYFRNVKMAHVFLVGKTSSTGLQQSLYQEQSAHQDIVQGDFVDAPENDTVKGLMGMRWVTQYCSLAKYIMKINDIVFVDTDKLFRGLIPATKKIAGKRLMFCDFNPESELTRSGPNGISPELFPGRSRLRPYCKGFAILMTRGVISSLLAASEYVPSIHLDDLYLYGILPFVAGSIDVFDVGSKRAFHGFGLETVNCYKTLMDNCPYVASVALKERFTDLWEMVRARLQKPHQGWENERSLWDVVNYRRRF